MANCQCCNCEIEDGCEFTNDDGLTFCPSCIGRHVGFLELGWRKREREMREITDDPWWEKAGISPPAPSLDRFGSNFRVILRRYGVDPDIMRSEAECLAALKYAHSSGDTSDNATKLTPTEQQTLSVIREFQPIQRPKILNQLVDQLGDFSENTLKKNLSSLGTNGYGLIESTKQGYVTT